MKPTSSTEFILLARDCLEGMRGLSAASVDLVVTSPPYNLGVKYRSCDDRRSPPNYLRWAMAWAAEIKRVLRPNGSFFLNLGGTPRRPLLPYELVSELQILFVLQNTFHWIKSISLPCADGGVYSAGHFKPINSPRFVNDCHEFVFHLTKEGITPLDRLALGVPYANKENVSRWTHTNGRDVRCRGNVWFVPYETTSPGRKRPHPATFPTQLAVNCIKIHGNVNQCVMMDPFLGIGYSALAAQKCGIRRFIGFDLDAGYIADAQVALNATTEVFHS